MTIKKLTVAAAIAVGITTCSFANAMAACPCNQKPVVTAPSCGCAQERPVVTGQACPCEATKPTCSDPSVSTLCPSTLDLEKSTMHQVYAYPNAIYGYNNYTGDTANSIFRGEGFSVSARGLSETTRYF